MSLDNMSLDFGPGAMYSSVFPRNNTETKPEAMSYNQISIITSTTNQMEFWPQNPLLGILEGYYNNTTPMAIEKSIKDESKLKRKRARTSFRKDQLQMLRRAFAKDQNPCTPELLRMSDDIGLPRRVLQVWFQNARAKKRRALPSTKT